MRYYNKLFITSGVLLLCLSLSQTIPRFAASGQGSQTPIEIVKALQDYYRGIESLSFSFNQTTKGQMVGRPKTGKGDGLFARVDPVTKMRWNYSDPDRQVLISDGQTISMYFEELNQMIIAPVSQSQADILFSFFAGRGNIEDNFTILDTVETQVDTTAATENGLESITLIPNSPDSQIAMINLFVTDDRLIRRIELIDHFETRTTITIANIIIDPFISKSRQEIEQLFDFSPPEGTEIIRQ